MYSLLRYSQPPLVLAFLRFQVAALLVQYFLAVEKISWPPRNFLAF